MLEQNTFSQVTLPWSLPTVAFQQLITPAVATSYTGQPHATPAVRPGHRTPIVLNLTADGLIIAVGIIATIAVKFVVPYYKNKIAKYITPLEDEKRINDLLAQIGVLTEADRVILGAFHDGGIDSAGYHLQRFSVINTYCNIGIRGLNSISTDVPLRKILPELEMLLAHPVEWFCMRLTDDLPQSCQDHMAGNCIKAMCNRLLIIGNLPIGILSVQYDDTNSPAHFNDSPNKAKLDSIYEELATIMRKRLINPSPVRRVFGYLLGTTR